MSSPVQSVILDFDGTVADSFAMAVQIAQTLLRQYGYDVPSTEEIYAMRELSAAQLIKAAHISPRHLPGMLRYAHREQKKIIHTVKPIAGIDLALKNLSKKYDLAIVSSSEADLINTFLKEFHLSEYIQDVIGGAGIFTKHRSIKRYLRNRARSNQDAVYIGDEVRDIDAARRASVPVVSVTWGFNGESVLRKNKPDGIVTIPKNLIKTIDLVLAG